MALNSGPGGGLAGLRGGQDVVSGILFIILGALGLWFGRDYPMGTAVRLGTGVFPAILSWSLVGLGAIVAIQGYITDGDRLSGWAMRPLIAITASVIAFTFLIESTGLVVTMIVTMVIAAFGTPETRWKEFAIFSVIMILLGVAMFIWGLALPIKALPL